MKENLSANLQITQKGTDEVLHRVHKLNIRKRSVLILLDKPQTIEQVLHRTVFPEEEIVEEIQVLIRDGFIELSREGERTPSEAARPTTAQEPISGSGSFHLDGEIILSEAKFQLVDFCVDSFGTESQSFVDQIRGCRNAKDLDSYLRQIFDAAQNICPDRLPLLVKVIKEINETA